MPCKRGKSMVDSIKFLFFNGQPIIYRVYFSDLMSLFYDNTFGGSYQLVQYMDIQINVPETKKWCRKLKEMIYLDIVVTMYNCTYSFCIRNLYC